VVVWGEFGRTPKVNKYAGRDHWPYCFSVLFAGAGVPGGTVIGASDREGGYPSDRPVGPPDLAAAIYRLGVIDTHADPRVGAVIKDRAPISGTTVRSSPTMPPTQALTTKSRPNCRQFSARPRRTGPGADAAARAMLRRLRPVHVRRCARGSPPRFERTSRSAPAG